MCMRLRAIGHTERQSGPGAPRSATKEASIDAVKSVMEEDKDATCGEAVTTTGLKRIAAHRILRHDIELKPIRKIKARRVHPRKARRRLEVCRKWGSQIESGDLDLEETPHPMSRSAELRHVQAGTITSRRTSGRNCRRAG